MSAKLLRVSLVRIYIYIYIEQELVRFQEKMASRNIESGKSEIQD